MLVVAKIGVPFGQPYGTHKPLVPSPGMAPPLELAAGTQHGFVPMQVVVGAELRPLAIMSHS